MGIQRKPFDFAYPFDPNPNRKKLPPEKNCGMCWHLDNGLKCRTSKGVVTNRNLGTFSDYCHWPQNHFTEVEVEFGEPAAVTKVDMKDVSDPTFAGKKDEVTLRLVLERAGYQCECDGKLCRTHDGRCGTMHVKAGGKTPLLLQPKDAKKSHSLENSSAMCAPCATACTVNRMNIKRKSKNKQQNDGQLSII